ncbi:MAG: right-handed parallel beta-helix repeat-containing protein, partial [Saprospiraceae bacterium]|nr:right-handed parallel beta-helix repeat-containing protein [Saprospiraceae bacterium]
MKRSTQLLVSVVLLLLLACSKDQFIQFESGEQIDLSEGITHLIPGDIKALHDDKDLLLIDNLAKDDPSTFTSFARSKTITIAAGSSNALQDAIDNSDAGDRIILESGDHTQDGTVLVNKSISIVGETGSRLIFSNVLPIQDFADANTPGLHVRNAPNTFIRGIEFSSTDAAGGTAILIENSENVMMIKNHFLQWQYGIGIEGGDRAKIFHNSISSPTLWQTGELIDAVGIVVVNGDQIALVGNDINGAVFGIFTGGNGGINVANKTTACNFGQILCRVPGFVLPDGTATAAAISTSRWFVGYNESSQNLATGYLVIDGANGNALTGNRAANNPQYDIELAGESNRFGFTTPPSFNNSVDAFQGQKVQDCGNGNRVVGGALVLSSDPCEGSGAVLSELARGAILKGANGIDIGPDGNLYIASVIGREIVVMNKESGMIIDRLGVEMGISGPDDLVFGPDGSLYWTDILIGEVGRMTPEGAVTKQFVAPGVNPVTFSPDGRLFVALDFLGDGLYELDPDLIEPPRPIIISTAENPFPLGFFNAFDFGTDGRLYGPLFAAGLVISVDVDRTGDPASDPFADGSAQVVATGFVNPASAKFDSEGMLTVVDQTGEVFKLNTLTGDKTLFTTLDPGLDNMVFDSDGSLYMTNNDEGWVNEILPSGQARSISPGGMVAPQGLAVLTGTDNQDDVFVADQYNLRQLDGISGEQENTYRGALVPEGPMSLILPMNLSTDGTHIVISSWFSGAVQVWDPQSAEVLEHYPMGAPIDAIKFQDDIVVSDLGLGGVVWASDNAVIQPIDNANVFAPA